MSVESNRWQDGAILANNPTIIAIREAQLIWPDTQIDCLVSIGCGNVPTKVWALHSVFTIMGSCQRFEDSLFQDDTYTLYWRDFCF